MKSQDDSHFNASDQGSISESSRQMKSPKIDNNSNNKTSSRRNAWRESMPCD